VIRQAISCDICAAEKKQTNHWFVASEHGGELRVSGWNTRNRMRPGSKHLCGQTCLHKLVDDFMARDVAARMQRGVVDEVEVEVRNEDTDASLTSDAAYVEVESSARLVPSPVQQLPKCVPSRACSELVAMPQRLQAAVPILLPEEPLSVRSKNFRAEAWEREREREQLTAERRPNTSARRRSSL
jgi:hypothetical protein